MSSTNKIESDPIYSQRLDKMACQPREGKRLWVWESQETCLHQGQTLSHRRIHRLVERTLDVKTGQTLLVPELEYDFWDTTLPARFRPIEVIGLYQDHGTHAVSSRPTWTWNACPRGSSPPTIWSCPWLGWLTTCCA